MFIEIGRQLVIAEKINTIDVVESARRNTSRFVVQVSMGAKTIDAGTYSNEVDAMKARNALAARIEAGASADTSNVIESLQVENAELQSKLKEATDYALGLEDKLQAKEANEAEAKAEKKK